MIPTFCWIHCVTSPPLGVSNLQDECELLLDMVGLGLGPKQLPYRGPGPPPADWDGLSVAVWNVPRKATQQQIVAPWTPGSFSREGSSLESKQISHPTNVIPHKMSKQIFPPNLESFPYWKQGFWWHGLFQWVASKAAMSKQGCKVQSAYRLKQQKGHQKSNFLGKKLCFDNMQWPCDKEKTWNLQFRSRLFKHFLFLNWVGRIF